MSNFIRPKQPFRGKLGLLWDVDGTLSDSYNLGFTSTQTVLANNGYRSITSEEYHEGTKLTTPRRLALHATGNPDNEIGIKLGEQFDIMYVALVSKETAPFYNGIFNLVESLANQENILQGALSNACGEYVRAVLQANDVSAHFSVQYGADEVSAAKPSPDGLLHCAHSLALPPAQCCYIGDSPTDGQAAKSAGMFGIGVTWGSHPVSTVSVSFEKTVHTVQELEKELNHWIATTTDDGEKLMLISQDQERNERNVSEEELTARKRVSWDAEVIDNEGMNKKKTDDEFWTSNSDK
eukprot:CAMPEP_0182429714 /NCGR_PEP_ID=MMETSP1167-20130531/32844_1 /TAXON_ID=2988 /ORGANISM="Mallomonas Sp, Strain CCMP3275" /LENGTH=294 /DNA_ID=CAMNT_0024613819 /DNA_START=119 /DNA_END=1003 /DNA_ORIENTATION=+